MKQLPRTFATLVLASATLWLSGCAAIITGGDRTIPITSTPDTATVTIYDSSNIVVANSVTPAKIKLKKGAGYFKGADYRMVIAKTGYQTQEIQIRHQINGWYFGNFALGGFLGLVIVDPLTGGMWTLQPDTVNVQLTASVNSASIQPGLQIVSLDQLTPAQRQHLVPLAPAVRK